MFWVRKWQNSRICPILHKSFLKALNFTRKWTTFRTFCCWIASWIWLKRLKGVLAWFRCRAWHTPTPTGSNSTGESSKANKITNRKCFLHWWTLIYGFKKTWSKNKRGLYKKDLRKLSKKILTKGCNFELELTFLLSFKPLNVVELRFDYEALFFDINIWKQASEWSRRPADNLGAVRRVKVGQRLSHAPSRQAQAQH